MWLLQSVQESSGAGVSKSYMYEVRILDYGADGQSNKVVAFATGCPTMSWKNVRAASRPYTLVPGRGGCTPEC